MTPIYTAELAPASSHGSLVSLPEIFINFGILLGYIVSFCISGLPAYLSWCTLSAGSVPAICIGFSVLLMPESPHRLVAQNCIEEAEHVLLKTLYNKAEASTHLVEIMGFAGFARSTALDGAQSEPEWNGARSNFTVHVVCLKNSAAVSVVLDVLSVLII
jgi:hypothetical protein